MIDITPTLVHQLIATQFPQWADLPIKSVEESGHDNRTFHLGDELLVRLPSAQCYAAKVAIEQEWLPKLAPYLTLEIPQPVAMGQPSKNYPWPWSIYKWLQGKSANLLERHQLNLSEIAKQLGQFLKELHQIPTAGAPKAGLHNFWRGGDLAVYNEETVVAIQKLSDRAEAEEAQRIWKKALSSKWQHPPVWIHGDLAPGNILVNENGGVSAIIDFGGMAIGDPACDLVMYWTFLDKESAQLFKQAVDLDADTWNRARGWALWKALITVGNEENRGSAIYAEQAKSLKALLKEPY